MMHKNNRTIRSLLACGLTIGATLASASALAFVSYATTERAKTARGAYQPARATIDVAQLFPSSDVQKSSRPLTLMLPSGKRYEIERANVLPGYGGARTFVGYFKTHGEDYRMFITEVDGAISGFMLSPEGSVSIDPAGSGRANAVAITNHKNAGHSRAYSFQPDGIPVPPEMLHAFGEKRVAAIGQELGIAEQVAKAQQDVAKNTNTTIDVMVVYTAAMVTRYSNAAGVLARLNTLVSAMNDALSQSSVTLTIRLVHTAQVSYSDTTDNGSALDAISPGSTNTTLKTQIDNLRNQFGADLVSLIRPYRRSSHGNCGVAWVLGANGNVAAAEAAYGFSIVSDGSDVGGSGFFCDDLTFAHELGHNMGLFHDNETPGAADLAPYGRGYVNNGAGIATIMAASSFTSIARYSNPTITCFSAPCGVAIGQAAQAHAAAALGLSKGPIAGFRAAATSGTASLAPSVKGDFNGDGITDLVWYDTASGTTSIWLLNGMTRSSNVAIFSNAPNWRVEHAADLNGDGKADLVWYNASTKETAVWLMNGTAQIGSAIIFAGGTDWRVTHTGDLNGDGKMDLVWFNSATKQTAAWLMNGLATTSFAIVLAGGTDWRVTHMGDLDGDAKADLVWYNSSTKQTAAWLMNGLTAKTSAFLHVANTDWRVTHLADMNGDNKVDLVWRNPNTRQTAVWLMNGLVATSAAIVYAGVADWEVTHTGDLNGDGRADFIWFNNGTKETAAWLMNGLTNTAGVILLGAQTDFKVEHVGDLNADGRRDLIWRNSLTGAASAWIMEGLTVSTTGSLGP
jgi:peptidyl-Asp metalloendopeptidase